MVLVVVTLRADKADKAGNWDGMEGRMRGSEPTRDWMDGKRLVVLGEPGEQVENMMVEGNTSLAYWQTIEALEREGQALSCGSFVRVRSWLLAASGSEGGRDERRAPPAPVR